ncbi:MAG TPA: hypothetical protein VHM92_00420 [Allosphingosinicella sp.]|nr:hypothetical protein [Allosphingosinicella sp.]
MNARIKIALIGLCAPATVLALAPTPERPEAVSAPSAQTIQQAAAFAQARIDGDEHGPGCSGN